MKSIWKVWFSRRRSIYVRIARKYHTTPWRVYYLGHGGVSKNNKDIKILEELQQNGVISHIYPW
ncbi:hypothetical protein [Bacteroides sp.]|uniref:hypothetical protein n=1 Tax=Bacteroides sp. TaxID=29523 RepID=UPI0025BD29EC|nr:hypothetical protein [Bacteroides sp.]